MTASYTPDDARPGDDAPNETVIETDWATIRVSGNATVFTAQVQNFVLGGMPGQGKSGAVRRLMVQSAPEIAEADAETGND